MRTDSVFQSRERPNIDHLAPANACLLLNLGKRLFLESMPTYPFQNITYKTERDCSSLQALIDPAE